MPISDYLYALRKAFLSKSKEKHYSQFGEDIILKDWIKPELKSGFYVDIGCYHPKRFSNTFELYKKGWRGINIDGDPLKVKVMSMRRPQDLNINALISDKEEYTEVYADKKYSLGLTIDKNTTNSSFAVINKAMTTTITKLLDSTAYKGKEIDVLSIDIEGKDFLALTMLDFHRYNPKIILIETHFRNINIILKSETYKFLDKKGYILANWVGCTLFFVLPKNEIIQDNKSIC